jgi:transcriptional regulator with PAS, ATPase and Fis domain
MANHDWVEEFPGAITVCDPAGIILEMNAKAARTFEADGGRALIGKNLLDCHPQVARATLEQLMQTGQTNVYTIEKKGVKKLIYQTPWYRDGVYGGFVEVSLEIPFEMPHFVREG